MIRKNANGHQAQLFGLDADALDAAPSPVGFVGNMSRPVHRWFRYSAGFPAEWVQQVIEDSVQQGDVRVLDPFAGCATTLLAAEGAGVQSFGVEAHPFVYRIARAKLAWRSDADAYRAKAAEIMEIAASLQPDIEGYPPLIRNCYGTSALQKLDVLRQAYETTRDDSPASDLVWLTLMAILRRVSPVGTAQWQYVLPKKQKRSPQEVLRAFRECSAMIHADMKLGEKIAGPRSVLFHADARKCGDISPRSINLVITSPPYPNNFDYADATRLEMSFMGEVNRWADLQDAVRRHLVVSCSQHVNERAVNLDQVLSAPELEPIRSELAIVCHQLAEIRTSRSGRKNYHLMIACYFRDMALVWNALRRVCASPSRLCFVIGDSAPYGIYVPVVPWLAALALNAGFGSHSFEKLRERNVKWKNRKHRVPLLEGMLWVNG
ncbi:MAG TPA: DNA methyltransferase [Candidatus Binataceae bacterium]|nr:DNA methyltransferase [Candidatus Binataceae bacterium]